MSRTKKRTIIFCLLLILTVTLFLYLSPGDMPEYVRKVDRDSSPAEILSVIRRLESDTVNRGVKKIRFVEELEDRLPDDTPPELMCRLLTEKQAGVRQIYDAYRNKGNRQKLRNSTLEALQACKKGFRSNVVKVDLTFQFRALYIFAFREKGLNQDKSRNKRIENELLSLYKEALQSRIKKARKKLEKSDNEGNEGHTFLKRQVMSWEEELEELEVKEEIKPLEN